VRSQAVRSGPHEWVLGFGERRLIDGIELAPRNDKHWKSGQVRDYEIYLATATATGAPRSSAAAWLAEDCRQIAFPPSAGRLLRFRVLSVQNPDGDGASALRPDGHRRQGRASARAYDAAAGRGAADHAVRIPRAGTPQAGKRPRQQRYLSETLPLPKTRGARPPSRQGAEMRMNGLRFRKGLGVGPPAASTWQLQGDWNLLRADLGVDDSCRTAGGLQFQVWGGASLLYDSGLVKAPARGQARNRHPRPARAEPAHPRRTRSESGQGVRQLGQRRLDRTGGRYRQHRVALTHAPPR
jgi:alpha-glucosidase